MAFVTLETALKQQNQHGAVFWKVYDSSGKILLNQVNNNIGLEASAEALEDFLKNCLGDYVVLRLYTGEPKRTAAGDSKETTLTLRVRLEGQAFKGASNQHVISGAPGFADFLAILEQKRQSDIERLKLEMELNSKAGYVERLIDTVSQNPAILTALLGVLNRFAAPAAPVISAAPGVRQSQPLEAEEILQRMKIIDPDYINTLKNMVSYLEKNPGVIDQIKPIFTN